VRGELGREAVIAWMDDAYAGARSPSRP
jgi:hypothetical protein